MFMFYVNLLGCNSAVTCFFNVNYQMNLMTTSKMHGGATSQLCGFQIAFIFDPHLRADAPSQLSDG